MPNLKSPTQSHVDRLGGWKGRGAGANPILQTPLRNVGLARHGHRAARPAPGHRCASLRGRGSRSGLGTDAELVVGGGPVVVGGGQVQGSGPPRSWRPRASRATGAPLRRSWRRRPPVGGPRPLPAMAGFGPAVAGRLRPRPVASGPVPMPPTWPCRRHGSGSTASLLSIAHIASATWQASHSVECTSASFGRAGWSNPPRRHWRRTREGGRDGAFPPPEVAGGGGGVPPGPRGVGAEEEREGGGGGCCGWWVGGQEKLGGTLPPAPARGCALAPARALGRAPAPAWEPAPGPIALPPSRTPDQ